MVTSPTASEPALVLHSGVAALRRRWLTPDTLRRTWCHTRSTDRVLGRKPETDRVSEARWRRLCVERFGLEKHGTSTFIKVQIQGTLLGYSHFQILYTSAAAQTLYFLLRYIVLILKLLQMNKPLKSLLDQLLQSREQAVCFYQVLTGQTCRRSHRSWFRFNSTTA